MNPSYLVGNRLRDERERLGLSQAEAGAVAGVSREMWGRYERGALPGGEVFVLLGSTPFDLLYILTGQRSKAVAEVDLLPSDERVLVDAYRRCNAQARQHLIQTAALMSAGMGAAAVKPAKASKSVKVGGSVSGGAVVVSGSVTGGVANGRKK